MRIYIEFEILALLHKCAMDTSESISGLALHLQLR